MEDIDSGEENLCAMGGLAVATKFVKERVLDSMAYVELCLAGDIDAVVLDAEAVLETQKAVVQIRHKMGQGYCVVGHSQVMMVFEGMIEVLRNSQYIF